MSIAHISDHPAVVMWRALQPDADPPTSVDVVKESSVYRLVSPDSSVIAKKNTGPGAKAEVRLYREVLSRIPSAGPPFLGSMAESGGEWIFTREVTGQAYRQDDSAHRLAVARWLASLHVAVPSVASALPDRSEAYYRGLLQEQQASLERRVAAHIEASREKEALESVLRHYERLLSHWDTLAAYCRAGPETVVHGDLVAHNVFVGFNAGSSSVVAIDWEKAGWGTPAEDLSSVDVSAYHRFVCHRWPNSSLETWKNLAAAGRFFRCLVFVDWVLPQLDGTDHESAVESLELCASWFEDLREAIGWR